MQRLISSALLLLLPAALSARGSAAVGHKNDWQSWSPRPEIAPRFSRDAHAGADGGPALRIDCRARSEYGVWRRAFNGIVPGKSYRITVRCRTHGVADESLCASARIAWLRTDGEQARPPDYVPTAGSEGGWTRLETVMEAPEGATSARLDLAFGWAPQGTAWWEGAGLAETSPAKPRPVRIATVYGRPRDSRPTKNLEFFCGLAEGVADRKPDIVLFPEGMVLVGTGKSYAEVSEPVPGPATERLGVLARKLHAYLVAGLLERVGTVVYNVAVLIDREGKVAGTYRKTHLPREEVEGGVTPGDSYPVFQTDFGKLGLAICWDTQFPEPIRAMALQGAEMILVPIWGGTEVLVRARAIENHVYLATSSYDMPTYIVDPTGVVLAQASPEKPVACAEVDLARKIVQPWLGDMKVRTWRERRSDLPLPHTGPSARK